MRFFLIITLLLTILIAQSCTPTEKEIPVEENSVQVETVVLDSADAKYGRYLKVVPDSGKIMGVLFLLPGLGQKPEDIFLDTKFHEIAAQNQLLTIAYSGSIRMTADSFLQKKINKVILDVLENTEAPGSNFFMGGFSAGGVVALRYTELCYQYPNQFPVKPTAVFMADSPVDLFYSWKLNRENLKNNRSKISVNESKFVERIYRSLYKATPEENPEFFKYLTPFCIDPTNGSNEEYLKEVAVRAYHDIDVAWRINNRNQTARFDNYIATSELINRLVVAGNTKAEFVQTFETGYRRDGKRHPHSWSIIDEEECIKWIMSMIK